MLLLLPVWVSTVQVHVSTQQISSVQGFWSHSKIHRFCQCLLSVHSHIELTLKSEHSRDTAGLHCWVCAYKINTCLHVCTCIRVNVPIQIHSLPTLCKAIGAIPFGWGNTRGKSCHVSQVVTRHLTEEDLRDANEMRWQHCRRLQDNVLNRNDWAWVQIGWQRLGYTEGKAETCWYERMMYNFLTLMCSSLKSFTTCLPWLPSLIQHPDSPIFICNMYFSNQMVLACILKENNMKNTRGKRPKTVLTEDTQLCYFKICNIWNYKCSFTQL